MRRALGLIVLISGLAACQSTTSSPEITSVNYAPIYFDALTATAEERAMCEAVDGRVIRDGLAGGEICEQTLADGGRICRDSDDCLSECMLITDVPFGTEVTGQCRATDNPFGCAARVEDGRAEPILCVD